MSKTGTLGATIDPLPQPQLPDDTPLSGRFVVLEPIAVNRHCEALWQVAKDPTEDPHLWDYMAFGPFDDKRQFTTWLSDCEAQKDPYHYAIIPKSNEGETQTAMGMAALMRITPKHAVIEVGSIWFAAALQKSRAATESLYLLMDYAFTTLGFRRLEWKCDNFNVRSKAAAIRLGFQYEGVFRQHMIIKQRNRDTAWFAIIDADWPRLKKGFQAWLETTNFDDEGRQISPLRDFLI